MKKFMSAVKWLAVTASVLFSFELVFGYTGTSIVIHSIAIRHILFFLSAFLLYFYCLLYIIKNKIKIFSFKDKNAILGSLRAIDWVFIAFIVSTAVSYLIIPRITGTNTYYAKCEILDSLMMLFIYFPVRFMISWKEIKFEKFEMYIYAMAVVLSALHIVLFLGQSYDSHFIESYFGLLKQIGGSQASFPQIILGHMGYPRVMYVTSVYIILGFYFLFKKLPAWKWYDYCALIICVFAMMTTMTKSIWLGVIGAVIVFSIMYFIKCIKEKKYKRILHFACILVASVLFICVLNSTLFNGLIAVRMQNSFTLNSGTGGDSLAKKEQEGSALSNTIKIEQTKYLISKWLEKPIFGYGYGAYVEDYIRSTTSPFSYEMQFPALIMKTGIVGIGLLLAVVVTMLITAFKHSKGREVKAYAWTYLLIAFGICVQTNPLILSFTGMSIVVFLMIESFSLTTTDEVKEPEKIEAEKTAD